MSTTKEMIQSWFETGMHDGRDLMFVVCDTWDWEDYPAYCSYEEYEETHKRFSENMQKVMEVYDLRADMNSQISNAINYVTLDYVQNLLNTREMFKQADTILKVQDICNKTGD